MKPTKIISTLAFSLLFLSFNSFGQTWNIPAGTGTDSSFIGTTNDEKEFVIKSEGTERIRIKDESNGNGIIRINAPTITLGPAATSAGISWPSQGALYFRGVPDINNHTSGYVTRMFLSNGLNGNNYVSVPGKLSIGVGEGNFFNSPAANLDVRGTSIPVINLGTQNNILSLNFGLATCPGCFSNSALVNDAVISADVNTGNLLLQTKSPGKSIKFVTSYISGGFQGVKMEVKHDGKVVIGEPVNGTPNGYRLFVTEGILTDKVKIALNNSSQWSDFVFEKNYNLLSLDSVEAFIKENKHLPGVPSADDVVSEGLDLAKMDATLLQKVEELTLYMIELQKKNEELEKQIQLLQKK